MKIIEATTTEKKELFNLTKAPTIEKLSNHKGEILDVEHYAIFEDSSISPETGELKETVILSIMTPEKEVFATNSKTFREMFVDIASIMETVPFTIQIVSGTSKKGREFITCTLV